MKKCVIIVKLSFIVLLIKEGTGVGKEKTVTGRRGRQLDGYLW